MNAELRDLYQELILDHGKKPRNFRIIENPSGTAEGYNPLCGDKCTVYANFEQDVINDVAFQGKGCAISQASASLMTQAVKGKSHKEVEHLFNLMQRMVKDEASPEDISELGKLGALSGVKDFPSRVKCATLAWHTLLAALKQDSNKVTTE